MVANGSCPEQRTDPVVSRPVIGVRGQLFKQRPALQRPGVQGDLVSANSAV
jgi:hypothetical protein